jgi:general L-amino acid transport system permease protein
MTTTNVTIKPPAPPGPLTWLKENLFSNWFNSLLTVLSLALIFWAVTGAVKWVFTQANWQPISTRPLLYLIGQYPRSQLWRIGATLAILSVLIGASWRIWGGVLRTFAAVQAALVLALAIWPPEAQELTPTIRLFLFANIGFIGAGFLLGGLKFVTPKLLLVLWVASPVVALIAINGIGVHGLPVVPTNLWGGLMVTFILAIGGIVISFPFGVLLALGRRSTLPVVSWFSTAFIEIIRGVPLIGLLFLSSIILPLFLPTDVRFDRLWRALVGMIVFTAAYQAENVRGGLAAVPPGQVEAAKALGFSSWKITYLIVLPQALRAVIPPTVGQFITLFKDTTLVAAIGVLDFLSVGRSILQANPEYIGLQAEVYLFIAAIFWVFSYLMSYASQRLETKLGVGER